MLRGAQGRAQVHTLRTAHGTMTQFPEDIATEFRRFYTRLYNAREEETGLPQAARQTDTMDYLRDFHPDALTPAGAEELDAPITK
ncbi:Hypothetical predicted protein, partial [Pelobates cultripes]